MNYPLKAGQEATVFSCLHATGDESVKNGKLELVLSDEKGNVLHTYRYEGDITSAMMGVKDSFTPEKDYYDFNLNAKLYKDGALIDETTTRYDCNALNPNAPELCPKEKSAAPPSLKESFVTIGGGIALVVILAFIGFFARRRFAHKRDAGEDNFTTPTTPKIM